MDSVRDKARIRIKRTVHNANSWSKYGQYTGKNTLPIVRPYQKLKSRAAVNSSAARLGSMTIGKYTFQPTLSKPYF